MRARRPSSLPGKRGRLMCGAWIRQTCDCDHGHLEAPASVRGLEPRPVGMQSIERCPARTLLQNDQEVLQGLRATVAMHLSANALYGSLQVPNSPPRKQHEILACCKCTWATSLPVHSLFSS